MHHQDNGTPGLIVRVMGPGRFQAGLTYQVPAEWADQVRVGTFVVAPLGALQFVAMIVSMGVAIDFDPSKLKSLISIRHEQPAWSPALYDLCQWMIKYYHQSEQRVLGTMIPKAWFGQVKRTRRRLGAIESNPSESTQTGELGRDSRELISVHSNALQKRSHGRLFTLNPGQQQVIDQWVPDAFSVTLLMGVTGSGKTEVYFHLIASCLDRGQQVILLVPEIGLTPALMSAIESRLTRSVALFHSGMTDLGRAREAEAVARGEKQLVVGTRSAVFLPIASLGLIILDEEHDTSYKQESGVRYHARDVAIKRAQLENVPILLGSATPSLESYLNAKRGRYQLRELTAPFHDNASRSVMMIDLKREHQVSGLSQTARRAMSEVLATGQQVLLFLNRRGYAPVLECGECGYRSKCPGCETYLTVHRRAGQLMCHHCGYASRLPELCPECHHKTWKFQGVGTEKLEESLTDLFPEARVIRIDRSSMDQKDRLTMQLQQIHEGQVDIVIGTQMIAKGHHFKSLGLVIVLELDSGLFSPDYRAMEQSLQLLVQIAGRVGREGVGQVLIQTQQPDHPMLLKALQAPYEEVMEALLASRATARMPPYVYFAQIRYESQQPERPLAVLDELKLRLSPRISAWTGVQVLGPALALHTKRAHYYRAHLLIVGDHRPALHQALDEMLALLPQKPPSTDRWTVDVDPLSVV